MTPRIPLFVSLLLAALPPLGAQDFERLQPNLPDPQPDMADPLSGRSESAGSGIPASDSVVILDELKGWRLVSQPGDVIASGVAPGDPVVFAESYQPPQPEGLIEKLSAFTGRPLTVGDLNAAMKEVVLHYRAGDRPVVDVVAPEQEVTRGVVQLLIIEGQVGEIRSEGARWFSPRLLEGQIRLDPGDQIRESVLLDDLAWINQNPFRSINLVFQPGLEYGQTDLILETTDRFPVRPFFGIDNTGTEFTNDYRLQWGANFATPDFLDAIFGYQFTAAGDFKGLLAQSGNVLIPLPWRHELSVFGGYADSVAELPTGFDTKGYSWQASVRYTVPLPALGPWNHEAGVGFDFKRANNNIAFGGVRAFGSDIDVVQWVFSYGGNMQDSWGGTSLLAQLFYGPGDWTAGDTTARYQQARLGSRAEYWYARFGLERSVRLPWDCTLLFRGQAQVADANLVPSEQLGVGGYDTVRGYEERELSGDYAAIWSTEIRSPGWSAREWFGDAVPPWWQDELQLLGFCDVGWAAPYKPLPGQSTGQTIASIGLGLRYALNPYMAVRFDYGWQLIDSRTFTRDQSSRAHFGVVVSY